VGDASAATALNRQRSRSNGGSAAHSIKVFSAACRSVGSSGEVFWGMRLPLALWLVGIHKYSYLLVAAMLIFICGSAMNVAITHDAAIGIYSFAAFALAVTIVWWRSI